MKKVFRLKDLDCASCAAKMERGINKIAGVENATVSFISQRLTVEADGDRFESIMDEVARICKKIEPDCVIIRQ